MPLLLLVWSSHLKNQSNVLLCSTVWKKLNWRITPPTCYTQVKITPSSLCGKVTKRLCNDGKSQWLETWKRGKGFHTWKPNCSKAQRERPLSLIHLSPLHLKSNKEPELLINHSWTYYVVNTIWWKLSPSPVRRIPKSSATPSMAEFPGEPSGFPVPTAQRTHTLPSPQAPKLGQNLSSPGMEVASQTRSKARVEQKQSH